MSVYERVVRTAKVPLLGLPEAYHGPRDIAEHDSAGRHIGLRHGDPRAVPECYLNVVIVAHARPPLRLDMRGTAFGVLHAARGVVVDTPPSESAWSHVTISINGQPFSWLRIDSGFDWVAFREDADYAMYVLSIGGFADQVALVSVDAEEYIAGSRVEGAREERVDD